MRCENYSSAKQCRYGVQLFLTLMGCIWLMPIQAAPTTEQWHAFNLAVIDQHITPRYQQLAIQGDKLLAASTTLCEKLDEPSLDRAKEAFNLTMDAWQGIQHVRFGPVEVLMRNFSMQFWPDKKNHVGKHLERLVASKDEALLSTDRFYRLSVSVKGLPAIERFLYSEDALGRLKEDAFRCKVNVRIASYIAEMGNGMVEEWRIDMRPHFQNVNKGDEYFEEDLEASTLFLKALVEPLEVIRDLKIDRPLGRSIDKAKYKRLESWRSGRSLRNIKLNISALESLYKGAGSESDVANVEHLLASGDAQSIALQFQALQSHIDSINEPLEEAIRSVQGRKDIQLLSDKLTQLHKNLETTLTKNGIHLGFNSRDGD